MRSSGTAPRIAQASSLGGVLITLAGESLDSVEDLFVALRHHRPGQEVAIELLRSGGRHTVKVHLSARPG